MPHSRNHVSEERERLVGCSCIAHLLRSCGSCLRRGWCRRDRRRRRWLGRRGTPREYPDNQCRADSRGDPAEAGTSRDRGRSSHSSGTHAEESRATLPTAPWEARRAFRRQARQPGLHRPVPAQPTHPGLRRHSRAGRTRPLLRLPAWCRSWFPTADHGRRCRHRYRC